MKNIGIVGAGNVGCLLAYNIYINEYANIFLLDIDHQKAEGNVIDINHIPSKSKLQTISNYNEFKKCDAVVITAGFTRTANEKRIDLFQRNEEIIKQVGNDLKKIKYNNKIILVTNPVYELSVFLSSILNTPFIYPFGCELDNMRLQSFIHDENVHIVGHHDDSMQVIFSKSKKLYTKQQKVDIQNKLINASQSVIEKTGQSTIYAPAYALYSYLKEIMK